MGLFEHFPYTNLHTLNLDWILRKFKAFESTVAELSEKVDNITDVSDDVERIDATVTELQDDFSEVQQDVSGLKTDVSDLKTDVSDLKTDVEELQTAVEGLSDLHGVPAGGSAGQVLAKVSAEDYETAWVNVSGGGGDVGVEPVFAAKWSGSGFFQSGTEYRFNTQGLMYDTAHTFGQLSVWCEAPYLSGGPWNFIMSTKYMTSAGATVALFAFDATGNLLHIGNVTTSFSVNQAIFVPTIGNLNFSGFKIYFRWQCAGNQETVISDIEI